MANKKPWTKWYWADWKASPEVRACSLTARGLWLEMLAVMDEGEPYGHLLINGRPVSNQMLANQAGGGVNVKDVAVLLHELEEAGVFSRTDDGVVYSRRMIRDKAKLEQDVLNGKGGGNPSLNGGDNPRPNPPVNTIYKSEDNGPVNGSVKAQIPDTRLQKEVSISATAEKSDTPQLTLVPTAGPPDTGSTEPAGFPEFYMAFPIKRKRPKAAQAYTRALRNGASPGELLAGAQRYAAERKGEDPKFTAHPTTWLNGECWKDLGGEPAAERRGFKCPL